MSDVILVREWDADSFHRRVLELEANGYVARRETYRITPEMSPETGEIVHLHAIELVRPAVGTESSDNEKT
jgi:DNA-binding IclR family transcriptional regulator